MWVSSAFRCSTVSVQGRVTYMIRLTGLLIDFCNAIHGASTWSKRVDSHTAAEKIKIWPDSIKIIALIVHKRSAQVGHLLAER